MSRTDAISQATRPVHVLAMGGTIAMEGEHATPALDADALLAAVPGLGGQTGLTAETLASLPGPQVGLQDALELGRRATSTAQDGSGVVVTHGTDTLEESAFLTDLMYAGDAPIVFTGAIRPASAPGADGAANLLDAVAVAGSGEAEGLGAVDRLRGRDPRGAHRAQVRLDEPALLLVARRRADRRGGGGAGQIVGAAAARASGRAGPPGRMGADRARRAG